MKKHFLVLIAGILCLQVRCAYAQKRDYMANDSTLSVGVNLLRNLPRYNSQYIKTSGKDGSITYTPEQLVEYGFRDGTVYESKKIILDNNEKKVFLERLASGEITLYKYVDRDHKIYYIKKDSSELQELTKDLGNLKPLIQGCESMTDAVRLASFTDGSLQKLVSRYNKCDNRPFPYKKIGILAGWWNMSVTQPSKWAGEPGLKDVAISSSGTPMIGVFGDFPFGMTPFSLHPELRFASNSFTGNSNTDQADIDALIKLSTLHMPIHIRYSIPKSNWRVFVEAGPSFTYNFENSGDLYYSIINGNTVSIETPAHEKLLADFLWGYSAGVGILRQLNFRKTLSADLKYNWASGPDQTTFLMSGVDLTIGFTF